MENQLIEQLGFDPYQKKYDAFVMKIGPKQAKIILEHFNKINRLFVPSQTNAIRKSIRAFGWKKDGGAIIFCTNGNIIEFQHRLKAIIDENIEVETIVVLGADEDAFAKVAPAKNRTKCDVIQRMDKTATGEEVTALNQLLSRRRGEGNCTKGAPSLTMTNAFPQWEIWKDVVRAGAKLTESFFDGKVVAFDPWKRQINAMSALTVETEISEFFVKFLNDMKLHYTKQKSFGLFAGMDSYIKDETSYMSGPQKATQIWYTLCYSFDRYIAAGGPNCEFGGNTQKLSHEYLVKKSSGSVYRKFLANPDGINPETIKIAA